MNNANKIAPGAINAEGQDANANGDSLPPRPGDSIPAPMHGGAAARDAAMGRVLRATSTGDRAAIVAAILAGLDPVEPRRAEEALAAAGFAWPESAPRRCLGAIVAGLARLGLIVEIGWTKGRSGPSHAGRVSLWLRASA